MAITAALQPADHLRPAKFCEKSRCPYVDPPYWGCEDDYGKAMFSRADFARLGDILGGIKGRFLLSINDVPEIRATFAAFHIAEVRTSYSVGTRNDTAGARAELLISNWPLPGCQNALQRAGS